MALMKIIYISVESDYLIVILFSPLSKIKCSIFYYDPKLWNFFFYREQSWRESLIREFFHFSSPIYFLKTETRFVPQNIATVNANMQGIIGKSTPRSSILFLFSPPPIDFRWRIRAGSEHDESPVIENSWAEGGRGWMEDKSDLHGPLCAGLREGRHIRSSSDISIIRGI